MTPRPMHRQDRQLPQEEAWALLTQGTYGVLSVVGDEGWPYAVPMHYTVMDGQIYLHCAKTGYKLDAIARDDRVCFTVTLREELVQDHATSLYESVVVLGRAALVTDQATHQAALALRQPVEDPAQAQRKTAQLNRAIQALGTVNLGALEEYQRVEERYRYLTDQKTDVETARQELEGVIDGITREMETIFRREFAKVQAAFAQTFADLFGGGRGTLALEDENDVLRCGIDIQVQPPGKTLRSISLLSGGERSLVAIALYFAILKVHPTPFCVMDEIEAALDEANGARFIRYLGKVAGQTQFLLITHRRETMEAADVLYGVTMERQGVSRVLKLDLRQAEELLGSRPA